MYMNVSEKYEHTTVRGAEQKHAAYAMKEVVGHIIIVTRVSSALEISGLSSSRGPGSDRHEVLKFKCDTLK